jgi:hypothetical protein
MYPRLQNVVFALTLFSLATGLRTNLQRSEGRAAVCFAGQFRSFKRVVRSAKDHMISAFSHPDVFVFLNLKDSGKGGNNIHVGADIESILETLKPVSHHYYNGSDIAAYEKTLEQGSDCYHKKGTDPMSHFSWHSPQFWCIQKCWDMVKKYEIANIFRYEWFVRARPDTNFPFKLKFAIKTAILGASKSREKKHAWLRKGPASDAFALMTRAAADSYGNTFSNTFKRNSCVHLPSQSKCGPSGAIDVSTECLLYRNLLSGRVTVHFDTDFSALPVVRPLG